MIKVNESPIPAPNPIISLVVNYLVKSQQINDKAFSLVRLTRLISLSSRFSSACDRLRKASRSDVQNPMSLMTISEAGTFSFVEKARSSFWAR